MPPKRRSLSTNRISEEKSKSIRNFLVFFTAISIAGGLYVNAISNQRNLDRVTLCPEVPSCVTVFLVDVTDELSVAQRQDFRNQIDGLIGAVPRYGKVVISKVDPSSEHLIVPTITRCNPGNAGDVSEFSGNPRRMGKIHEEKFKKPLLYAFDEILDASMASQSPILEAIQSVNLTELQAPGGGEGTKKLIVVSDLLQNSDVINFYAGLPDYEKFLSSDDFFRVRTDLNGVDVELWMLQREGYRILQSRRLPELWERIIAKEGGNLLRVYRVSG